MQRHHSIRGAFRPVGMVGPGKSTVSTNWWEELRMSEGLPDVRIPEVSRDIIGHLRRDAANRPREWGRKVG